MSQLATPGQLRMSFIRWALITVPATVLLGSLSGLLSNSGFGNRWFDTLNMPDIMPPGWVFGTVWPILYAMLGFALAMILNARGAQGRALALGLYAIAFIANLLWSPLFFAAHQVTAAFYLILFMLAITIATAFAFGRIRSAAAWLLVPYMVWISFASILNYKFDVMNPDAETLAPPAASAQL
ncbi:MAG: tryptophan-rich sensory protein [Sphingopyxis sp.]|nr:tryptophan-rich sensory protein [Sphingopyxis sp.]